MRPAIAMHPHTSELLTHLEHSQAELSAAVDAVPEALRDEAPDATTWSVAHVLEHLAQTAAQTAALLERGLRKLEHDGLHPATDTTPVLPTLDTASLLDRTRPVAAPDPVQPKAGLTAAQARQALANAHQALTDALRAGDGIDVAAFRAPHPALGELGFHQWAAFVGCHERRHAAQVRAVHEALLGRTAGV